MEISIDPDAIHSKPSNFQGLAVQFDASLLGDSNGSKIINWNDSSGNARDLDQVRGSPILLQSTELDGKFVVRFDGFSQLFSTLISELFSVNIRYLQLPDTLVEWMVR